MVVNTDPSEKDGKHWVAFFIKDKNTIEYFDTFGCWPPKNNSLYDYITENFQNIVYNKLKIQANYEDACGPYCIYFLWNRCKSRPFNEITNELKNNRFSASSAKLFVICLLKHL